MVRSAEEIKTRCLPILQDKKIVALVAASSSPTAAYEMVFAETQDMRKAKAGRWLAIIHRDFFEEYQKIIPTTLSHANNGTAQKDKGANYERNLCE